MATETVSTSTKANGKSKGRKNAIGGFIVDKIDGEVMRAYVQKNELENVVDIDETVPDEQLGISLALYFTGLNIPVKKQVRCDACHGVSSADEETCPFCGDGGSDDASEDEDEEEEVAAAKSDESQPDAVAAVDDEDDEPVEAAAADDEDDEEGEDEEEAEDPDGGDDAEEEEEAVAAAPAKKTKKKGTSKMATTEAVVNGAATKKTSKGLTKGGSVGMAVTAKDLDRAVAEVIELKSNAAESYWHLGKKLIEINEKQLWKLRVKENGKAAYNGFDAFCQHELNMSANHAYKAIQCAQGYETPDEVRELGHTKAALLLQAAPEDRKKLTAKAKAGATKRQLEKDVKESRAKKGGPLSAKQQSKAGAKAAVSKAKTAALRSEKISIANIEGLKTVKLYKKPDSLRGVVFTDLPRAHKLSDQPIGRYEMTNGVVQYFTILAKDGELVIRIETRREAGSE